MQEQIKNLNEISDDVFIECIGSYLGEDLKILSSSSKRFFSLHREQSLANSLLLMVAHGTQDLVKIIITRYPQLLLKEASLTNNLGDNFYTTPFKFALWSRDVLYMARMMLESLPNNLEGNKIKETLISHYNDVKNEGISCRFNKTVVKSKGYDIQPLFDAYQIYISNYSTLSTEQRKNQLKVIAVCQASLPNHVLQHLCDLEVKFAKETDFNAIEFKRSLAFYNCKKCTVESIRSSEGFGRDFALSRTKESDKLPMSTYEALSLNEAKGDFLAFKRLWETRELDFQNLFVPRPNENPKQDCCVIL